MGTFLLETTDRDNDDVYVRPITFCVRYRVAFSLPSCLSFYSAIRGSIFVQPMLTNNVKASLCFMLISFAGVRVSLGSG